MSGDGAAAVALRSVGVDAGGRRLLADIDLTVAAGERVAVVGPSGAGKTTLLSVAGARRPPTVGEVRVLGVDPWRLDERARRALRSRIGAVHQDLALVGPLRVVHNVNAGRIGRWSTGRSLRSLVRPHDVQAVLAALDRVGLADRVLARTDRLSGGERQRVALARVLVQRPALLVADEPVASLDPARAEEVVQLLVELVGELGAALVLSSHAFDLARRHCDRVVGLRHGRVVFDRRSDEVDDGLVAGLYRIGRAER